MSVAALSVRERPILFSGAMVRAILDGTKTQTRRVVKPQPNAGPNGEMVDLGGGWGLLDGDLSGEWRCPYGAPGDRLWVRESWQDVHPLQADGRYSQEGRAGIPGPPPVAYRTIYRADGEYARLHFQREAPLHPYRELCSGSSCERDHVHPEERYTGWCPSIHMPRWASRLTLEITDVRAERVQAISEADARAEGVERHDDDGATYYGPFGKGHASAVVEFRRLWDSLNAARGHGWDANPWVWAITFRRLVAP